MHCKKVIFILAVNLYPFGMGAAGNSSYGYWAGGWGSVTVVSRIDYSNDTTAASPKGPLTTQRTGYGATGDASYGYFAGRHMPGGVVSSIDRIDYSNDTATASPKGPLSAALSYMGGA